MKPTKLSIANLPTPIQFLKKIGHSNIYIKRDDFTGMEVSGNKIRKLEYAVKEAIDRKATVLITCGGLQSNHARATVAVANQIGLKVHLVLRGKEPERLEGNYLLNHLMGATMTLYDNSSFINHNEIMLDLKAKYKAEGVKAYIIPMGASNGIGNFGYENCFTELIKQEKQMQLKFDAVVCTVGSGGTYAGLFLGNHLSASSKSIIGINISSTAEAFKKSIQEILLVSESYLGKPIHMNFDDIHIVEGYAGEGYALSTKEELQFIKAIATEHGLILDPVYTGKAFRGLIEEIKKGHITGENILFIHTGGLYGVFPFQEAFGEI